MAEQARFVVLETTSNIAVIVVWPQDGEPLQISVSCMELSLFLTVGRYIPSEIMQINGCNMVCSEDVEGSRCDFGQG
jgi:hypothetical protein